MDYGNLNLISLLFGLLAITIPFAQKTFKVSALRIIISFSFSLIAIGCQIAYQNHLVTIEDFSAIADTMGAVLIATIVLIVLTILSNVVSLLIIKNRHVAN